MRFFIGDHLLGAFAKFSKKLMFPTPCYAHAMTRTLVSRKILRTYKIHDPTSLIFPLNKILAFEHSKPKFNGIIMCKTTNFCIF